MAQSLYTQSHDIRIGFFGQVSVQRWLKRWMDIAGAFALLLILSPLIAIVSIGISFDSPGEILFRQTRIGKDGRPFILLKFRTMKAEPAEIFADTMKKNPALSREYNQYQKLANDPRLTRIGRVLRRFSLDEIPQLWNVIRGEMSLVGPRPFLPEQAGLYGAGLGLYYQVRPGLTGLWQVSGRNQLSFQQRAEHDCDYLLRWSLWKDLTILARTPGAVLWGRGAY